MAPKPKYDDLPFEQINTLFAEGFSGEAIARKTGSSRLLISQYLQRSGLSKTRTRSEAIKLGTRLKAEGRYYQRP